MLNSIFRLLAIKPRHPVIKEKPGTHKPLRMQMVYGVTKNNLFQSNIDMNKTSKVKPDVSFHKLEKQQKILEAQSRYFIEKVALPKDTQLIGLMRHDKVMMQSVFVFESDVPYTDKWPDLKNQAIDKNCGISFFKTTQEIQCLKLTERNHVALGKPPVCSYLIDYRAICPDKQRAMLVYPEINTNSLKNSI